MNILSAILFVLLLFLIIPACISDIKYRALTPKMMIYAAILAVVGIVFNIIYAAISGTYYLLILTIIAIGIYFALTAVNANRIKNTKPILIGGADTLILLVMCINCPVIFGIIPSLIIIPFGAFVLSTMFRMIPKFNRSFTERGIPYIPFMALMWIFTVIF